MYSRSRLIFLVILWPLILFAGCAKSTKPEGDTTSPVPGNSGVIIVQGNSPSTCAVTWTSATDNTSGQAALQYKVVLSPLPNITTVSDAETNGTTVTDWITAIDSTYVTGLTPATDYHFNVIVRDEEANAAAYSTALYFTEDWALLWTDSGNRLWSVAVANGDYASPISTFDTGPWGLAMNYQIGAFFVSFRDEGLIQHAVFTSGPSPFEDLITSLGSPHDLVLDWENSRIYWTDFSAGKIQRANLDGSGIEDLAVIAPSTPLGIALDLDAGKMYWTDPEADKIQRANLDGTGVEDLVTTGITDPHRIALDITGGKMYWTDCFG